MAIHIIRGPDNAPIEPLHGLTTAVLGFGNQGAAHALNMRDSGLDVIVANRRDTANGRRAADHGFEPLPIADAVGRADLVVMALPDEAQPELYGREVAPHLRNGAAVGFLHGFNIRYGFIRPAENVGVVMVAPKGPGRTLRRLYEQGHGLPCLFAVHQEPRPTGNGPSAEAVGLAWANAIGSTRAAIVRTSFADETETDLFGEQAVLCGGLSALIRAAFETLCEAGYAPELAYLECCHEVSQVTDLVYKSGLAGMCEAISNTAEFGAYRAGPLLIDEGVRRRMSDLLREVRDGTFAKALRSDHHAGGPWFERQRAETRTHPLETAGEVVRSLMPWLTEKGAHQ